MILPSRVTLRLSVAAVKNSHRRDAKACLHRGSGRQALKLRRELKEYLA